MQIGGKRFSRFKKGGHGTCEHTRTHDLDLQIPEESLSGLVPGAAGVDLDLGQLDGLLVLDFEDNLVVDGDAVDVLGAHQGLRNLNPGPLTSGRKRFEGLCVRHLLKDLSEVIVNCRLNRFLCLSYLPVQCRGDHHSLGLVDPDHWASIAHLAARSEPFPSDRHVENVGVAAVVVVSGLDFKRHSPFFGQGRKSSQKVVLGKFLLTSQREGCLPRHILALGKSNEDSKRSKKE